MGRSRDRRGDWVEFYTAVWGNQILWGDQILGDQILWGDRVDWADNATSVVWGNQLLWGDSLVRGDRVIVNGRTTTVLNGDNIVWRNSSAGVNDPQILWGDLSQIGGLGRADGVVTAAAGRPFASNEPH